MGALVKGLSALVACRDEGNRGLFKRAAMNTDATILTYAEHFLGGVQGDAPLAPALHTESSSVVGRLQLQSTSCAMERRGLKNNSRSKLQSKTGNQGCRRSSS